MLVHTRQGAGLAWWTEQYRKLHCWLEMSNIDLTVLTQTSTRLILKIGDDLRQDMITLRMFSLFEKVS